MTNRAAVVLVLVLVGGCGSVTAAGDASTAGDAPPQGSADGQSSERPSDAIVSHDAAPELPPQLAACAPSADWRFRLCGTYDDLPTVPAGRCIVCFTRHEGGGGTSPLATNCAPAAGAICVASCDACTASN
jgi:hypothetical protein